MRMKWLSTFLLLLVLTTEGAAAGVIGRWSGSCDFPGWPQIYGVFTADADGGSLTVFQANLLDESVTEMQIDGDSMAFDVSIHGSAFSFKGRTVTEAGIESLSGTITAEDADADGGFEWKRSPVVSELPDAQRWSGTLDIQGIQQLDMILDLGRDADDRLHVDISIPVQKVVGYPLDVVSDDGTTIVAILHTGLPATLTMERSPERIDVQFKQGAFQQEIVFTPDQSATTSLQRPQEPTPPFPYEERDVVVPHPDGHVLAGTLTVPRSTGPHPAVILITGSGLQDRNQELMGHKPFLVLADHLTRNGIAVLRADDRGVGGSTVEDRSTLKDVTSKDFASDISVLFDHLVTQPDIDTSKIGLVGHSEGGFIAPMVAERRDDVAFLVLMAGTGRPGLEVLKDQNRRIMEVQGVDEDRIGSVLEKYEHVMDLLLAGASDEQVREPMRELSQAQIEAMGLGVEVDDALIDQAIAESRMPWMQYFMRHDPAAVLERIDVPVFAINGTLDVQVLADRELPAIEQAVQRGSGQITVRRYEGLNHLFQPARTGAVEEYDKIEITLDPQVLDDITQWINGQGSSSAD